VGASGNNNNTEAWLRITGRASKELDEDVRRLKECRAGNFIEHDKVDTWLRSIGTNDELPIPS